MSSKTIGSMFSGKVDFVDLYNQAVLTGARRTRKARPVPKQTILSTTKRNRSEEIVDYTEELQESGHGVTVSDVLALINDETVHEEIYDDENVKYTGTPIDIRKDANVVMDKLLGKIAFARENSMTVPLILSDDYYGTIASFYISLSEDMIAERRT